MNWFRTRLKLGARIALAALLVQAVVAFGHTHAFAVHAEPALQSATASDHAPLPDHNDADHACAICAVLTMAQSVLFSAPPILSAPEAVDLLHRLTIAEFSHIDTTRQPFQSRAPPAS